MAHWRKLLDSEFIGSWDLEEGDWTGTMSAVESEEVENANGKKRKGKISFEEAKKPFLAGATILKTIAGMYGKDTNKWPGNKITLYATECNSFGDMVDCIRVRPQVPK